MNNDFQIDEPVYFEDLTGQRYRITIRYDDVAESPRGWTNGTVLHTFDNRWNSPDDNKSRTRNTPLPTDYLGDGWVDMRRARRWAALYGPAADVLAIVGIDREPRDGTLSTTDDDEPIGYIAVTTESWEETQGKAVPFDRAVALQMIEDEVEVYNKWQQGEFTSYLVEREQSWQALDSDGNVVEDRTMTSWDVEGSVGGFDDEAYAFEEAVESLPEGTEREE